MDTNVRDFLIEPNREYLWEHEDTVRALFDIFYDAFRQSGSVTEDGELHIDRNSHLVYDACFKMERFMRGKPLNPTVGGGEEFEEFKRDYFQQMSESQLASRPVYR